MKRTTRLTLIVTGTVLVLGTLGACAHHYRDPEHRSEYMVNKVSKELDLDAAQKTKLEALSQQMLQARNTMVKDFGADRSTVLAMLDQPTLDQAKLLGMVHQHTEAMNQQAPKMVTAMADFYNSLNAEQRAEVRKHLEGHHDHHGHWGHD